jgi:type IV pilus assembly protein PilQ
MTNSFILSRSSSMRKMLSLYKKGPSSFIYLAIGVFIMSGCTTLGMNSEATEKAKAPLVQSIRVTPSPDKTIIEIINTGTPAYSAYKLADPPRVVIDIRGERGSSLPLTTLVNSGNVKDITFEQSRTQAMTVRATVTLEGPFDYGVESAGNNIRLTLTPEKKREAAEASAPEKESMGSETIASEPRVFVKDDPSANQVLGIDFKVLEHGKTRVVVSTDKKVRYEMDQKGSKDLVLRIPDTTIPPFLMRQIDSQYLDGVVDRIKASSDPGTKGVSIGLKLREMVPFHVRQAETAITIDFGGISVKGPEKRIVPLQLAQAPAPEKGSEQPAQPAKQPPASTKVKPAASPVITALPPEIPGASKRYTGVPMTLDFVNADVTNILRLIGEVSNLNIVWGPEVRGTVSMRLKDVPWDQALDLILENNNLGKKQVGNVIWVTTKAQLTQSEAEERRRIEQYEAKLDAERKKAIQEREKEKELEPMVTEYLPVDFATANEIMGLISLSDQGKTRGGKLSTDARTNTIIITDIASNVKKAKAIVRQFDTPVKQVMIEARIVDATNNFTRDLGIQWQNFQVQDRTSTAIPFTTFTQPSSVTPGNPGVYPAPPGGSLTSPGFSSVAPNDTWTPNMGLVFSNLTASGLTATVLDAKLALSEIESTSKTISAPKVVALNGKPATIARGTSIIIPATENVASTTLDATLSLTVTPTVSFNNFISLDVSVTDDKAPSNTRIDKKSINTKMMVKSGDTVVIGGIYTEDKGEDESGIPGLRQLPYLGWLFKAQTKTNNRTELLIFLTPTVLPAVTKS